MAGDKIIVTVDSDLEELIPGFLENRKADVSNLTAAVQAQDMAALQSIGHNLKGLGGGYGFQKMSDIGAAIEAAADAADMDSLLALLSELDDYLDRIEVVYE